MLDNTINILFDNLTSIISSFSEREKLKIEIQQYAAKQYDKLKFTKNVLFRSEPVSFYKNYIPLTLTSPSDNIRVKDPIELLQKFGKICVIGTAGSGKSTLLRFIALTCIEKNFGIPVIIELRKYNSSNLSLENYIAQEISESHYLDIKKIFKKDGFVFIFDGYDEIDYVRGSAFINQIEKFVSDFSKNKFIISSRPGTNVESLHPFYVFKINPLNINDISLFLETIDIPDRLQTKIFETIQDDSFFREVLNNPLLLSLYILTFNSYLEVPRQKTVFLRNIIDFLFSFHDSISKLGYVREKISGLDKDHLEKISSILAFRAFFSGKNTFLKDEINQEFDLIKKVYPFSYENEKLLYDLTITVNILNKDDYFYSFPHILILEYLASLFISNLDDSLKSDVFNRMKQKRELRLSASFFEFLYELDRINFTRYYLISALEELTGIIRSSNENYIYNQKILIDFVRNNSDLKKKIADSDFNSGREILGLIHKLKEEVDMIKSSNSNPLFDILN